jgi:hypothetical protein
METVGIRLRKAVKKATNRTSERYGKLFTLLLTQEKYDDAKRAVADSEYRTKLFEKYGI